MWGFKNLKRKKKKKSLGQFSVSTHHLSDLSLDILWVVTPLSSCFKAPKMDRMKEGRTLDLSLVYHAPPFPPFFFFCWVFLRVAPGAAGFCCRGGTMLGLELVPDPGRGDVGGLLAVLLASLSYRKRTVRKRRVQQNADEAQWNLHDEKWTNGFDVWFRLRLILLDRAFRGVEVTQISLTVYWIVPCFTLLMISAYHTSLLSWLKYGHDPNLTYTPWSLFSQWNKMCLRF